MSEMKSWIFSGLESLAKIAVSFGVRPISRASPRSKAISHPVAVDREIAPRREDRYRNARHHVDQRHEGEHQESGRAEGLDQQKQDEGDDEGGGRQHMVDDRAGAEPCRLDDLKEQPREP